MSDDEFVEQFEELDAVDLYQQFRLRNAAEFIEAWEEFEGDEGALGDAIHTVTASEEWTPWSEFSDIDRDVEQQLRSVLGSEVAAAILQSDFAAVDEIRVEQEGEEVTTEVLIHQVKEWPNTHTVTWVCTQCGATQETFAEIPYQQPPKPGQCRECDVTAKKYISLEGTERTHGFLFKVTAPNQMPSQDARKSSVWVALDDIDVDADGEAESISALLEGYGAEVEVSGQVHFKVDTTRGEMKNSELWILADSIAKSRSDLEEVTLTEEDRTAIRQEYEACESERAFFDTHLAPDFIGRSGLKRAIAYTMATPLVLMQHDGKVQDYGVGRLMIVGDPGTAKSKTTSAFLKSTLAELGAEKITAEYLSIAGLGGTVTKSDDGFWEIDWGILPHVHEAGLVLDGMHQFSKKWLSKLREIMEESVIKIVKAAKGETDCAARIVGIANTNLYPIKEHYPTNYQASFDIGIGSDDDTNKLSGADRRRWDVIWVANDDDVQKSDIDTHLIESLSATSETVDSVVWRKLWAWIWSLEYEDYNWSQLGSLKGEMVDVLNEWRSRYPDADLAVLGNKGSRILVSYVMASAALHCRVDEEGKVSPTEADLEHAVAMFEDMFGNLELEKWQEAQSMKSKVARAIYQHIAREIEDAEEDITGGKSKQLEKYTDLVKILQSLGDDPTTSLEEVGKEIGVTRKTVYNRLNMELEVDVASHYITSYSAIEGYRDAVIDISPLVNNGRLTKLGKQVLRYIRQDDAVNPVQVTGDDDDDGDSGEDGGDDSSADGEKRTVDVPDDERVCIRFSEALSETVMGVDLEEYGPFDKGEEVELPAQTATILVERGVAEVAG